MGWWSFPVYTEYRTAPLSLLRHAALPLLAATELREEEGSWHENSMRVLFLGCSDLETDLVCEARGYRRGLNVSLLDVATHVPPQASTSFQEHHLSPQDIVIL